MLTFPNPIRTPVIMRSRLCSKWRQRFVAANEWAEKQTLIQFRVQGASEWKIRFFASDAPGSVDAVANGEADIAICNPGSVLAMAARGRGPWQGKPLPLRSIMAIPQFDQLGFAVSGATGLKTLADLKRTNIR